MQGVLRYDDGLASLGSEELVLDHNLGLALHNLQHGIEGRRVVAQLLPRVKGKERDTPCVAVLKLLAHDTSVGIVDHVGGGKYGFLFYLLVHSGKCDNVGVLCLLSAAKVHTSRPIWG